jgi:RNA polymerase-binding transcription factor DksA
MTPSAGTMTAVTAVSRSPEHRHALPGGPRWRALLEARWRVNLQRLTELSVAYHDAAVSASPGTAGLQEPRAERLMHQAVAARRALADTDEALSRLAAGRFGLCEYCAGPIPPQTLLSVPEARYCPRCASEQGQGEHWSPAHAMAS